MKQHDTYQRAVTPSDIPAAARDGLMEALQWYFDASVDVELGESPNGIAELRLSESVPTARRRDVVETVEDHVGADLSSVETVVLNQRVSWPEPRYELCIDHR